MGIIMHKYVPATYQYMVDNYINNKPVSAEIAFQRLVNYPVALAKISTVKTAKPRSMKELAGGRLSEADIQRLIESYKDSARERQVRHLGTGATQHVDMVLHPRHGLVARKRVRHRIYPQDLPNLSKHPDIDVYRTIADEQNRLGRSGFARIHEVTPAGLVFQEPAIGKTIMDDRIKMFGKRYEILRNKYNKLPKTDPILRNHLTLEIQKRRIKGVANKVVDKLRKPVDTLTFSPEQRALIENVKKQYPGAWDYDSPWNLVKGDKGVTMIDMSGGGSDIGSQFGRWRGNEYLQFTDRGKPAPSAAVTPGIQERLRAFKASKNVPSNVTPIRWGQKLPGLGGQLLRRMR